MLAVGSPLRLPEVGQTLMLYVGKVGLQVVVGLPAIGASLEECIAAVEVHIP